MGEPEQRHGPLPRSSGSTRTVGSVAEELAAAQGSSQVCCCGARHAWPACWFPPKRLLLMSAALMCPLVFVCCRLLCLQVVLEGDLVNLGVTSPAAALALGLMYLQTNDAAVAAAFVPVFTGLLVKGDRQRAHDLAAKLLGFGYNMKCYRGFS